MSDHFFTSMLRGEQYHGNHTFSFILGCKAIRKLVLLYNEVVRKKAGIPGTHSPEPTKLNLGAI